MPMTLDAILDRFAHAEDIPAAAVDDAVAQREICLPAFRRILQAAARKSPMSERDRRAIFYIVHVLADMDAKEAFPDIVALLTARGVDVGELLAESMLFGLGRVLASLFDGDTGRLASIIDSPVADELAAAAALDAAVYHAVAGGIPRDTVASLIDGLPDRREAEPGNAIWSAWATAVAVLGLEDQYASVEEAIGSGSFNAGDETLMTVAEFQELVGDAALHRGDLAWLDSIGIGMFTGTVAEMEQWDAPDGPPPEPVVNPYRHVGRNDPCPCGSGKKFKKCCGATA